MPAKPAAGPDHRLVLHRFFEILNSGSFDELEEVLHQEFVSDTPQSGERVRGIENQRQIFRNFPGGIGGGRAVEDIHVVGSERQLIMTPTFHIVQVEGIGDSLSVYVKGHYPDGTDWFIVNLVTFRDGKISRTIQFFAPLFEPPGWRARWVEKME
jgi:ketosteroid isomerase-like protein